MNKLIQNKILMRKFELILNISTINWYKTLTNFYKLLIFYILNYENQA